MPKPLNTYKNPEDRPAAESYAFNQPFAKKGNYTTALPPADEQKFQAWVKSNKVPWQDTPQADYDMRGYYQALQQGKAKQSLNKWDGTMHFPDTWKTPYSGTFSNESQYATPDAPHWQGDKLIMKNGQSVVDETPAPAKRNETQLYPSATPPDLSAGMISKLKGQLPAPLQRVLGSTGLNVVSDAPHVGAGNLPAIASVDPDSVNTVAVEDPQRFVSGGAQTLGHEATHLWQNNLPPTVAAKIPTGDPNTPYAFSEADLPKMRAAGKTLSTVPREVGPSIIQKYISEGGSNAPASVQKIYDPWVKDMQNTPLSTIIPTQPGQAPGVMNTTPRPPLPQF